MHYYQRNIGDYAKKAGRLSLLEHGVYTLLMDACYDREAFPTEQEAIEWCWARTPEEIEAVRFVLDRFFVLTNGKHVQKRIAEELRAYHETRTRNQRIATEREAKRHGKQRVVHDSCTERVPDVHEAPPNHKPITNNQEPNQSPRVRETQEPPEPPPRSMNFETFEPATRAGAIAILLRDGGIQINSMQPVVQAWANRPEVTDEILVQAALTAKKAKPGERIGSAYLAPIVEQLLKPRAMDSPAAKYPAWRTDDREADKLGRELGVKPATMETYDVYRSRIAKALRDLREKEAA